MKKGNWKFGNFGNLGVRLSPDCSGQNPPTPRAETEDHLRFHCLKDCEVVLIVAF